MERRDQITHWWITRIRLSTNTNDILYLYTIFIYKRGYSIKDIDKKNKIYPSIYFMPYTFHIDHLLVSQTLLSFNKINHFDPNVLNYLPLTVFSY